ncbi:hypothetical protein RvY_01523-1 [Ramazzottius varieornatus]|uniref:Uncharacterized protein n=1 Tax=Ramazzottius varieornatus TaxID=947166 RepID=A0A1D1URW4_RAMVA|nr:hypothetical protein RvY_01523-1 [Ramazzottius varieornatus]
MEKLLTAPVGIRCLPTGKSCVKLFRVVHQSRQPYFRMTESNVHHILQPDGVLVDAELLEAVRGGWKYFGIAPRCSQDRNGTAAGCCWMVRRSLPQSCST